MAYRKKGQRSKLLELAKRRKLKAAKDKEGKLEPMVIKPALSKLRTGAVSRRKKGGQTLVDLAKRRKPAVKKKPASSQSSKFGSRIPVGRKSPATKAQTPKKRKATSAKTAKSAVPPSLPKKMRGKPPAHKAIINYVKENPVEVAAEIAALHPAVRGVKWGASLVKGAHKAHKLRKAERLRKANNARKAKERREKLASKKTEDAYKQFEKDRKERSRKMGRR